MTLINILINSESVWKMTINSTNGRLPKVFISVAPQDSKWASEFIEALRGSEVSTKVEFNDPLSAEGVNARELANVLRRSKIVVMLLSPENLKRPQLYIELGAALADHKKIVPVLMQEINERRIPGAIKRYSPLLEPSPREAGKRVAEMIETLLN